MDPHRYGTAAPSVNFFSEDFIAGFQPRNRMSVVRRFFCLFVTFDLIFVSLLWLICVVITGENIYTALEEQVMKYTIEKSLFDVVVAAGVRFILLIFFYGVLQVNHWLIIALTTTSSCGFLITKVIYYTWPNAQQPVFQVLLIIISFVISWFEAWFLDSRMIPQEEYSRSLTDALQSSAARETTPLLAPFLQSVYNGARFRPPESFRQSFYSPVESVNNDSDDEDEEFKELGIQTVIKAYELLECDTAWKIEKTTSSNDVIYTTTKNIGKIYKLRAKVDYSPKKLLYELFYKIEDVPTWNPTLLESRIIKKIDEWTDISYSVSQSGGGGVVKSRDFVNLRCWKLMNNSRVIENFKIDSLQTIPEIENHSSDDGDNENSSDGDDAKKFKVVNEKPLKKSASDADINDHRANNGNVDMLSKSLGVADINCVTSDDDEPFSDAQTEVDSGVNSMKNVFVSAAMSVDYNHCPPTTKYIRGQNIVSCWAMRPVEGDENSSIFEWLLCIDLKGSLPKYILNTAFTTLMQDYMVHLRKRIKELNLQESNPNHQAC